VTGEEHLKALYVSGEIEIEEFEERLTDLLGEADSNRERLRRVADRIRIDRERKARMRAETA
jgi:hypothetical protein